MREISYVEKKELLEVYGDGLEVFKFNNASAGGVRNVTTFLEDQIEVVIRQTNGPFTICEVKQMGGDHRIIVPNNLVKKGKVDSAREKFKPILDKRFPGLWFWPTADDYRNYDGSCNPQWVDQSLILVYPVVPITNSLGHKHTLHNMLVKLDISDDGGIYRVQGGRATLCKEEIRTGFRHSHIHSQTGGALYWDDFCLGAGTMRNMIDKMKKPNSAFEFSLFLDQLKAYLEWESLEGTPYISIRTLGVVNTGAFYDHEVSNNEPTSSTLSVARQLVELLLQPPHQEVLSWFGSYYMIDPSNEVAMFKLEKALTDSLAMQETSVGRAMMRISRDYDLLTSSFISGIEQREATEGAVHYSVGDIAMVGQQLGIPKVVKADKPEKEVKREIIRRLPTNKMEWIIREANSILINGRYQIEA
jgi:hypothetical protein